MRKPWIVMLVLVLVLAAGCINQTVHTESTFLQGKTFEEVWDASIRAVEDIDFTIDSMDKSAGFLSAESGSHVFQEVPPRLSILISEQNGRVNVDCRMLQKEQLIDLFGIGKKTVRNFMVALNRNLN